MRDRLRRRLRPLRRGDGRAPDEDLARLLSRLNPATLVQATGHRVILHRHLTALGLDVPRLHGVIGRGGGWSAAADRPVLGAPAAGRFLDGLAGDLAVRPYAPSLGARTRLLLRQGADLVDTAGRRLAPAEVAAEAFADPACALFLVQERVDVRERLRLTTFLAADGRAAVVHAGRLAAGEVQEVDPGSTGAAGDLARRAALAMAPQRSIAWDVAVTPAGPLVLAADGAYAPVAGPRFEEAVGAMASALAGEES